MDKRSNEEITHRRLKMPPYSPDDENSENIQDANIWFLKRFPESVKAFGAAFMQGTYDDMNGLPRFVPMELNEDAWAACLGGDKRLGHRVIFYPPENAWYFYDPLIDAYCPTTEAKLRALLSNYLIRCAEDCGSLVDIEPLITRFRTPAIMERIIQRAKALLAADKSFFEGKDGHKRIIDGRVLEPSTKPCYELFVEKKLVKEPNGAVTATDVFSQYFNFCREHHLPPLTRHEATAFIAAHVREAFGCGIRHDVPGPNGKHREGWKGVNMRVDEPATMGLS